MVDYFKSIYFNQIVVCLFFTRPEKTDTKKKQIKEAAKQNKKQRNCYYIMLLFQFTLTKAILVLNNFYLCIKSQQK